MSGASRSVRIITTLCAAVAAVQVTAAALLGKQAASRVGREQTFIGCLQKESATADFLLTHANPVTGDRATLGTGTYHLAAIGSVKLIGLAGHKVRLVGAIEKEPPRTGGPQAPLQPVDERSPAVAGKSNPPVLRVSGVRSLAPKCP
jgi:hypothetical protein